MGKKETIYEEILHNFRGWDTFVLTQKQLYQILPIVKFLETSILWRLGFHELFDVDTKNKLFRPVLITPKQALFSVALLWSYLLRVEKWNMSRISRKVLNLFDYPGREINQGTSWDRFHKLGQRKIEVLRKWLENRTKTRLKDDA